MEMQKKVQRIRIVEIERSWTTLHKMLIGLILITFLAVICDSFWVHIICSLLLLAVLIFSLRKLNDLRHHGMTVIIERPDEPGEESQSRQTLAQQTFVEQSSSAADDNRPEKANWFEQPYPDPDEDLFPENNENVNQQ